MKLQTSGTLLYRKGYKYVTARRWSVKTPITDYPFIIPSDDKHEAWVCLESDGWMHFRAGYACDGPSGGPLTPDAPCTMRGAWFHDGGYQGARSGRLLGGEEMRQRFDEFARELWIHDGMSEVQAWAWYEALRGFAGWAAAYQAEEVHEAPTGRVIKVQPGQTLDQALTALC